MSNQTQERFLNPQSIIVRMPNWLGDLVMATPILQDLRDHWPHANITAYCQGSLGFVIEKDPNINQVINFKRPKKWFSTQSNKEIIEPLRKGQYDLGILLTNSFSSALLFWQGEVKYRLGYIDHWRRWLLNLPVPFPDTRETQHLVKTYKMMLNPLGIPVSERAPQLYLTEEEKKEVQLWLKEKEVPSDHVIVGINPGAAYGSAKCWLPERYREIAQRLIQNKKTTVLFFGDPNGAPLVNEICQGLPDQVINVAGKTSLRQLMAHIQNCHLFLTNDSGPMHMASALGTPLIALFGSTSDVATGPYQGGKVIHKRVPCSPCYRRECPIDFRCMTRIGVDEVYQELQSYLNDKRFL